MLFERTADDGLREDHGVGRKSLNPTLWLIGMRFQILTLAIGVLLTVAGNAADAAFYRHNVIYFLSHSDATAHIRILNVRTLDEFRDNATGAVGYKRFEIAGQVLEAFKGSVPNRVVIRIIQEQPSEPPHAGEFIVSLNGRGSSYDFADSSALWVAATPELILAARAGE
jgi:hypothetical protein